MESKKNDYKDKKNRWDLLPLDTVDEVVKVYTFGAQKYGINTWQDLPNGIQRYKGALIRHLVAYDKGERQDPESGLHPLAHAVWNALAMLHIAMKEERISKDTPIGLDNDALDDIRGIMATYYFNTTSSKEKDFVLGLINKIQLTMGDEVFIDRNEFENSTANEWAENQN